MAKIVGIGGVSRSGKSTLARLIANHFTDKKVLILSQDEFVKGEGVIPKIRARVDWEHPDSIDMDRLLDTIKESEHSFDLIIVEGLLAFWFTELNTLYDVHIFIKIDKGTFLERRKEETRWGKEPKWFWEHVWRSYLKYGQNFLPNPIQISGEVHVSGQTFKEVIQNING